MVGKGESGTRSPADAGYQGTLDRENYPQARLRPCHEPRNGSKSNANTVVEQLFIRATLPRLRIRSSIRPPLLDSTSRPSPSRRAHSTTGSWTMFQRISFHGTDQVLDLPLATPPGFLSPCPNLRPSFPRPGTFVRVRTGPSDKASKSLRCFVMPGPDPSRGGPDLPPPPLRTSRREGKS